MQNKSRHRSHGYPRPQLQRAEWTSLNGPWEFALDPDATWAHPGEVSFRQQILVPFAPESLRSGVNDTGLYKACWYKRTLDPIPVADGVRIVIHFGAVDYDATVWIDGALVARHEGGYTPFEIDATSLLRGEGPHELVVRAEDDPGDMAKPRGKQDWKLEPHSIWYPRTTGIWQTVWLERVPATRITHLRWTPNLERWEIALDARVASQAGARVRLKVTLHMDGTVLADDEYTVIAGEVQRRIALSDPGIDDFRNELLWSPSSPNLISAKLVVLSDTGESLDVVTSYTALRSVSVKGDRIVLNGRPFALRMVLDQGYWLETGLTPPDDDAIRRDVELTKQMGFNGARKHQKIEDPRYLYWADRLGLLVWEEMPSAYRFTKQSIERLSRQWLQAIERDISHPCIIAWVPFNESWGVPNLPDNAPERHYVEALYHLTKTMDPTRPVIGNDGWESVATDIIGIHDYEGDPQRLAVRYFAHEAVPKLLAYAQPGGRAIVLDRHAHGEHPIVLSEFGGIACARVAEGTWGYGRCAAPEDLAQRYAALVEAVASLEIFAGYCYTQLTDTYQEANGLLYADRTPKFPIEEIARITLRSMGRNETPVTDREGAPR